MDKFQNKYRIPSARAQWWDYGNDGAYFITICTAHRECYFGTIITPIVETPIVETPNLGVFTGSVMVLSDLGEIVQKYWLEIPEHFSYVKLDAFVVMPNHFHGIIIIENPEKRNNVVVVETPNLGVSTPPPPPPPPPTKPIKCGGKNDRWHKGVLGVVINQFKRKCTIECRKMNKNFGWQSRFYDNIIRDQKSNDIISAYIKNNPAKWVEDKFHPSKPDTEI